MRLEEECCTRCKGCQRIARAQIAPNPGEASGLCVSCWEQEDPDADMAEWWAGAMLP